MTHSRRSLAAVAALLSAVAACGTTAEAGPAGPVAAELALPFDAYRLGHAGESEIQQAQSLLVKRCMRGRGLEITLPESVSAPGSLYDSPNMRRYGVLDDATALEHGYHFPKTAEETATSRELQNWSATLTDEQSTALYGEEGKPGCADQADTDIAKAVPEGDDDFLSTHDFDSLDESAKTADVVRVTAAWRDCMAAAGFRYADPNAAISDPRWDLDSPAVPEVEVETARADVRCKDSTRLVSVWHDAEVSLQRQVIDRNAEQFGRLEAGNRTRLANARRILAG
ncbi:MAG: hypothetical protein QOI21_1532 [Actinomycetota bacterium]|jgi:hypothetical protein|nr:hypothetical protein [Actinomycetota bacterium]